MSNLVSNLSKGFKVLHHFLNSTFWDWSAGSALIFWRWPPESCSWARNGFPINVADVLPNNLRSPWPCPASLKQKKWAKLRKFFVKSYICITPWSWVKNVTEFFGVPKGEDDISIDFNGTKSELTSALWAPSFWIPNASSILRTVSFGHRPVDIDLGEYFINLPLAQSLRQY